MHAFGTSSLPDIAEEKAPATSAEADLPLASDNAQPPTGLLPEELMVWMSQRWREGRADLALAAFRAEPELGVRQQIAQNFAMTAWYNDPHLIAQLIFTLPEDEHSDRMLSYLLESWAGADPEEAFRFYAKLPANRLNVETLQRDVSRYFTALAPAEVMAFARKLTPELRRMLIEPILYTSAAGSWQNFQAWLALVPDDEREAILIGSRMAAQLAQQAPDVLQAWSEQETNLNIRDDLKLALSEVLAEADPVSGFQELAKVSPSPQREATASKLLNQWLREEQAQALAWLQSDPGGVLMKPTERSALLHVYGLEVRP